VGDLQAGLLRIAASRKRLVRRRWRTAGADQVLQLIIIKRLAYRLRKGSRLLYRDPAYLICTDSMLEARQVIEAYFERWEVEVNFRDEKTLLGIRLLRSRAGHGKRWPAPRAGRKAYATEFFAGREDSDYASKMLR
jgi:hypothetical protein